jgi:hypothetical protein
MHLLRHCDLALRVPQLVSVRLLQIFSFDTPYVPEQAHQPFHPQRQLRGDGGEVPFAGHAFEGVIASVFELKS